MKCFLAFSLKYMILPLFLKRVPYAAAAAKSLQSCPTLCDPMDRSPPGSSALGFSRQEYWSGVPLPFPCTRSYLKCKYSWEEVTHYTIAFIVCCSVAKSCLTLLQPHRLQPAMLLRPWDSPGKNTRVGCHFLLQGIFLTQGSNSSLLRLLHWQANCLPLSHQRSPTSCYSAASIRMEFYIGLTNSIHPSGLLFS